jgi:hypothetical protein
MYLNAHTHIDSANTKWMAELSSVTYIFYCVTSLKIKMLLLHRKNKAGETELIRFPLLI